MYPERNIDLSKNSFFIGYEYIYFQRLDIKFYMYDNGIQFLKVYSLG